MTARVRAVIVSGFVLGLFAVGLPVRAQDGVPVGAALHGVPVLRCSAGSPGCIVNRTELVVRPERFPGFDVQPYFPQHLAGALYRRAGIREEPLSCEMLGDGLMLADTEVLVAPFVSLKEAMGSGLDRTEYEVFLSDERNYHIWRTSDYLARSDRDPAYWVPTRNICWYVARFLATKQRWSLSVDPREADALSDILDVCSWDEFEPDCRTELFRATVSPTVVPAPAVETARWRALCDSDADGSVSCSEIGVCGAPRPVKFGDPLYSLVVDADSDGVACR